MSSYSSNKKLKTILITLYLVFAIFCAAYFPIDFSMELATVSYSNYFYMGCIFVWIIII